MILRYVFTFIALIYLTNCSVNNNKDKLSSKDEFSAPEIQFTQAMLMFDNQQYELATNKFKNIERIYPLSNEAIQSQIMQGFMGCRKVFPHFVQGFILFFAFDRFRKSSKSAKPRKTNVNCSFLRSRDQIPHVFKGFLVSGRKNVIIT